ncbi:terpenoid synthase [Ascobolus immersus RN42]|uniref:Terpenoid synthase n=1 Tax=Ascobolus immersus RN42 TaxID=1160509 RepID=A0A3N4IH44_ASCIM|nr:terpenoid synthase [Ascobolus immersus RN42]
MGNITAPLSAKTGEQAKLTGTEAHSEPKLSPAPVTGPIPSNVTMKHPLIPVPSTNYDALPPTANPKETYAAILLDFFDGIGFSDHRAPDAPPNEACMAPIRAELQALHETGELPEKHLKTLLAILPHASSFATIPYPVPLPVQIYICKFTTFFIHVDDRVASDDLAPDVLTDLSRFPKLMTCTLPEAELELADPVLKLAAKLLRTETHKYFSPYQTGVIFKSAIDYLMGCMIEAINCMKTNAGKGVVGEEYEPRDDTGMGLMIKYTRFLRLKTALSEAFSALLFPLNVFPDDVTCIPDVVPIIPMLVDYIDFLNDILSYYKESVVGEEKTYFTQLEKMSGVDKLVLLKQECDNQVRAVLGVRRLLEDKEDLRKHFDLFFDGYVRWHNNCERYYLGEVGIGCFFELEEEAKNRDPTMRVPLTLYR